MKRPTTRTCANERLLSLFARKINLTSKNKLARVIHEPFAVLRRKILVALAAAGRCACRVNIRTFWGKRMCVVLPEKLSLELFRYGFYEEDLTWTVLQFLRPGKVFLDVGAHIGYFALLASEIVGTEGLVVAFEPTRSIFSVLAANTEKSDNITINNLAAFSHNGEQTFNDYGLEYSMFNSIYSARLDVDIGRKLVATSYPVEVASLDSYASHHSLRPDFIKIDAENAEFDILKGMSMILDEMRPILSLEVGDITKERISSSHDCISFLKGKGYIPIEIRKRRLQQHVLREKYTYSNLLFIPEERSLQYGISENPPGDISQAT